MDGDTSTNDCVFGLASGAAGNQVIEDPNSPEALLLGNALTAVCQVNASIDSRCLIVCVLVAINRNFHVHFMGF